MLLLASWLTSGSINSQELVPGQVYNTGNIVLPSNNSSSWTNGVFQSELTCWANGNPGYCGPNAIIRPGNNVNFSWGSTYIYQQQSVSSILPSATGLQVNGYDFSFRAKNGNGWDNGMTDQLTALVRFWDTTGGRGQGNLLYGNSYNLNYKFDWTDFNYSQTFTSPLTATSIGQVQYGFIGKDNNGWAGPYGPEVTNISFNLRYSVDPCIKDPLYSPTCSGFLAALNQLSGASTTSSSTTTTSFAIPTVTATTTPTSTTTTTTVSGPPPSAVSADTMSKVLESNKTAAAASVASITAATNLNDKSSVAAFALSVIAKNAANDRALQEKTVSDAIASANAAATSAVEQSQAIALSQSLNSANSANRLAGAATTSGGPLFGVNTATAQPAAGATINALSTGASNANGAQNNSNSQSSIPLLTPVQTQTIVNIETQSSTTTTQVVPTQNTNPIPVATNVTNSFELLPPAPTQTTNTSTGQGLTVGISSTPFAAAPTFIPPAAVTDVPKFNEIESNRTIDMSSPTDFVAGYINTKHNLNEMQVTVNAPAVNSKAQDNDAAGGVSIAAIAKMPIGYDLYTSLSLKDVNFYKPEELYRGQKTVDNVRLLRGLTGASDRVHQEMVDEQYKNK